MRMLHLSSRRFRFSLTVFVPLLFASLAFGQAASPADVQELEINQTLERQIATGDSHQYKLALRQGQVLSVDLDELSFNAKVELIKTTDHQTLAAADLGTGMERETLTFSAEQGGDYLLKVSAGENESGRGRYRLTARLINAATGKIQTRIRAERLLTEAVALNKEGTPDKIREAIGKGEQALVLWRNLGDRYWESYTLNRLAVAHKGRLNSIKALAYFEQSLAITKELGDKNIEALRLIELGATIAAIGERQKANEQFDQALQLFKTANNRLGVAMAFYWLGDNTTQLGDKPKALEYFNQALLLMREEQHKSWEASVLYGLGLLANAQNDKPRALDFYKQALALWRAIHYEAGEGLALLNIGKVYVAQGEAQKALEVLNQALPLFRSAKNKWQEAATFQEIGTADQRLGKAEDAIAANKQQLAIYQGLELRVMEILLLGDIAGQYQGLGKYAEAIRHAEMAVAIEAVVAEGTVEAHKKKYEHAMQQSQAFSLNTIGMAYYNSGNREKALLYYQRAFAWFEKDGKKDSKLIALKILSSIAQVHGNQYEWEQTLESYHRALAMAKEIDSKADIAQILNNLGMIHSSINEKKKALECFEESLAVNRSISGRSKVDKRFEAGTLDNIGSVYLFLGEPQKALDYHQQAVAVYKDMNEPTYIDELATTYGNIGHVHHLLGENQKALTMYEQALELFRQAPPHIKSLARNRTKEANFLSSIAAMHSDLGENRQALKDHQRVLKMAIDAGDKDLEAKTRNSIGLIHSFFGEHQKALEYLNQALAFFKAINNKNDEAILLNNIAHVYSDLGENQKALEYYNQIMPIWRAVGNRDGEAKALNNIGLIRSIFGESQIALEYFNQAVSIYRAIQSKRGEAITLNNMAMAYSELGEKEKALELMNQALALSKAIGSKDGEATTLDNLGSIYSGLGENRKALEYHNQVLPIRRAIGDKQGEATTLNNLGTLYAELGEKRKALDYYDQSLRIARAVGHRRGEATTLNNIGSVYRDLGERQKALEYYQQALLIRRAVGDRSGEGTSLNSIGMVYLLLSENEKTLDHFSRALEIARQIGDKASEASYLNNLAILYSDTGERGKALAYFDQALAIDRAIGSKSAEATVLGNMAWDYFQLGENQKALEYREKCLQLSQETGEKREQITARLGIGSVYREWGEQEKSPGRLKQALDSYKQALQLSRQTENEDTEASALSGIGRVLTALGETEKAAQNLSASLQLAQTYQNRPQEVVTQLALGHLFETSHAPDKAVAAYQQALVIARAIADKDGEAKALRDLMSAWWARGNVQLAIVYGKQAINKYQELRSAIRTLERKTQEVYREKVTDAYRDLANLLIAEGRLPEAQAVLDLLKNEEFKRFVRRGSEPPLTLPYSQAEEEVLKIVDNLASSELEFGELTAKVNAKQELTDTEAKRFKELQEIQTTANRALRLALKALATTAPDVEKILAAKMKDENVQDILPELGSGTVALYTVVGKTSAAEKTVKGDTERTTAGWILLVMPGFRKAYPIDTKDLEQTVFKFHEALQSPQYDPRPLAHKLYRKLFLQTSARQKTTLAADLETYLGKQKDKTLMWSLDGILRYVPTAALYDGQRYFVEKYRNVIFNIKSLKSLKDLPKPNWEVLGLGVSEAKTVKTVDGTPIEFAALAGAETELRSLIKEKDKANSAGGILPGVIRMNRNFTKQALFEIALTNPQVIHIASHFWFNPAHAELSFLLLGDGNRLDMTEFQDYPDLFRNVDLLSLSACDTAIGGATKASNRPGETNGEEVEGFAYLAQELGAKSVMASLWQVSDEGTKELMLKFYQIRQANPQLPKGEALREAQLALLQGHYQAEGTQLWRGAVIARSADSQSPPFKRDENAPYAHPYFWSSFVLIGNWR